MKKNLVGMILVGAILLAGPNAWSADAASKFGRGIINIGFGWFEIFNEIGKESDQRGPLIGFPSGLVRGTAFALVRTLAGVYETVTFPFPNGKRGYESVILPESVFKRR